MWPVFPFIAEKIGTFGQGTSYRDHHAYRELSQESAKNLARRRKTIQSGSDSIDSLLEGGYKTGEIVEVFGESNTGKTQLALQAALSAARMGFRVVFVDTEATFRPERLARMADLRGADPDEILSQVFSVRAETTAKQTHVVATMERDERVSGSKLVVVDTVSKNFTLEFGGERRLQERQSLINVYLNRLARDAFLNNRAVVLMNRVASGVSHGRRTEFAVGGQTLKKFVSKALHLQRRGTDVDATLVIDNSEGRTVRCRLTDRGFE